MKVKIGDIYFNSLDQPIMIILNEKEKKFISEMTSDMTKFCATPPNVNNKYNIELMTEFMEEPLKN